MFNRHLDNKLKLHFQTYENKVLVLLGARQVGKTTILKRLFPEASYLTVDNEPIRVNLESYDPVSYAQLFGVSGGILVIDEIHKLSDPGRAAKIICDQMPQFKLIVTGSSAFNIKYKASESLAGRKIDYHLYQLTLSEFLYQKGLEKDMDLGKILQIFSGHSPANAVSRYDRKIILDDILNYGMYPDIVSHPRDTIYLTNLIDSVVFKDLTELSLLENKTAALSLLKLLAFQIGSLINYSELASKLSISSATVKRYIDLFEQSFIIFTVKPFTSRKRDEIAKMSKVYFYDLGLRNALINNFEPMATRGDAGHLFENFVVAELLKYNEYENLGYNFNFWRTKSGSEMDLVLSKSENQMIGIEIMTRLQRTNLAFHSRYSNSKILTLSRDNYWVC